MATISDNHRRSLTLKPICGGILGILLVMSVPMVAFADALVIVEVATPEGEVANGTVELTPKSGEGPTVSCETKDGKCEIDAVAGGLYQAKLVLSDGKKGPKPKTVMIPPSGRVTLHVSTQ